MVFSLNLIIISALIFSVGSKALAGEFAAICVQAFTADVIIQ